MDERDQAVNAADNGKPAGDPGELPGLLGHAFPDPFPEYIPCPRCGEPEIEVWCYQPGATCHNCGRWVDHPRPTCYGKPGCQFAPESAPQSTSQSKSQSTSQSTRAGGRTAADTPDD
jgi:hypothetical protein